MKSRLPWLIWQEGGQRKVFVETGLHFQSPSYSETFGSNCRLSKFWPFQDDADGRTGC